MAEKKKTTPKKAPRTVGPMEEVDVNVIAEGQDVGYFDTTGTVYANLPKADEPVAGGPYDPTVRDNKLNDDGSYQSSKAL